MSLQLLDQTTEFLYQTCGDPSDPPIIYLPGVHGDWTPLERARRPLSRNLWLTEVAYPRVVRWGLEDFAQALERLLDELKLESAHLIGESFGSLIGWQLGGRAPHRIRSLLLVGGFCRPPRLRAADWARWGLKLLPNLLWDKGIEAYVAYKRLRGGKRSLWPKPYPVARTTAGRRALGNRLAIIQRTDFCGQLSQMHFPVRYLGGERDWLVGVEQELEILQEGLPAAGRFASRILAGASHALLVSHPHASSHYITQWVWEEERRRGDVGETS